MFWRPRELFRTPMQFLRKIWVLIFIGNFSVTQNGYRESAKDHRGHKTQPVKRKGCNSRRLARSFAGQEGGRPSSPAVAMDFACPRGGRWLRTPRCHAWSARTRPAARWLWRAGPPSKFVPIGSIIFNFWFYIFYTKVSSCSKVGCHAKNHKIPQKVVPIVNLSCVRFVPICSIIVFF